VLRLDEPRLLSAFALEPLLAPPKALPEDEERLAEELGFACEELALGDVGGRLADEVPPDGRAPALAVGPPAPVEGRAPALPVEDAARFAVLGCVEGRVPPEP
jgi:hypothetical protein